jgi:hypothetical protein
LELTYQSYLRDAMSNTPPNFSFSVPEGVTFEQAIALTQSLLPQIEQGKLTEADVETAIAALVQTENGARGFFVTYLTDASPLADHPSAATVQGLRSAPEMVAELLVKNLAMSSAMAVAHRRNQNEEMAQGSDQVRSRTAHLIQLLQLPEVTERARRLHETAATGIGHYSAFLDRWGYDAEQRQVIQQAIAEVFGNPVEKDAEDR